MSPCRGRPWTNNQQVGALPNNARANPSHRRGPRRRTTSAIASSGESDGKNGVERTGALVDELLSLVEDEDFNGASFGGDRVAETRRLRACTALLDRLRHARADPERATEAAGEDEADVRGGDRRSSSSASFIRMNMFDYDHVCENDAFDGQGRVDTTRRRT